MRHTRAVFACLLLLACFSNVYPQSNSPAKPWTVKEIFGGADLTGYPPDGISWSPDGKRATYIDDNGDVMQIEVADGKLKKLLDHTKIATLLNANISEKDRDHRARYDEPDYIWSPDSQHLLFDTSGELWLYNLERRWHSGGQYWHAERRRSEVFARRRVYFVCARPQSLRAEGTWKGLSAGADRFARQHDPGRRDRLGVSGRAERAQQLFLVARFEAAGLPADE